MDTVRLQRDRLCDLLDSLSDAQWDAETLCDGWDAGDVAGHLLVREREPWAAVGVIVKPLASLHDSRMAARKAQGREAVIRQLRSGPPRLFTLGAIGKAQVSEDYIHTEDVRRGGAALLDGPADLTPDDGTSDPVIDQELWEGIGRLAIKTLGGVKGSGVLAMTDGARTRAYRVGGPIPRTADGGPADVTVSGTAGELLLYTTGRRAARVEVDGDPDLISALSAGRKV